MSDSDGGQHGGSKGAVFASSPTPVPQGGAHRTLVVALGEPKALAQLGGSSWLPSTAWNEALEAARRERFPSESVADGFRRVGQQLGRGFLDSDIGRLTRETASVLPPERVFGLLLPMLAQRMRSDFAHEWQASPSGGVLRITGSFAANVQVTLGFLEAFTGLADRSVSVSLQHEDENRLEFAFQW
jgi:uncharacterized protein (TIGR02265 family)